MDIPVGMVLNGIDAFLLVFVRMTGLFVVAPIFGRRNIPAYFKIAFSFMLALILVNTITLPKPDYASNIYSYAFMIAKEFIVGITLGFVSYTIFCAIYVAGQIVDMQVGFGVVNVMDPVSNIQVPITSNFYFIISMLVFLGVNGHHALIKALFESYNYVPLGGAVFNNSVLGDIVRIFGEMFVLGFKISAPIVAALLITDVALGVISRSVPQLNVFVVGLPLKILLGIIVMIITVPMFVTLLYSLMHGMNNETINFMKDLGANK